METIDEIPQKWAQKRQESEYLVCKAYEEVRLTWKEVDERINRLGNALREDGYEKGDQLAIMMKNSHELVELYYACYRTGIVPIALNYRLSKDELSQLLGNTSPSGIVAGPEFTETASQLAVGEDLADLQTISAIERDDRLDEHLEDYIETGSGADPGVNVAHDDLAMLLHTGGTTGLPKIVPHTHKSLLGFFEGIMLSHDTWATMDETTVNLMVVPLFHVSLWPVFVTGYLGGTVVLLREPEPEPMLKAIEAEGATTTLGIPTIYYRLADHPDVEEYDLSSMEIYMYGGSPFHQSQLEKCISIFGNKFSAIYGATEGVPWTFLKSENHHGEKLKSVGKEAVVADVRIYDEEKDRAVEVGETGEIVTKSPGNFEGYWGRPEKTEQAFTESGFFRTGDLGRKDEDGFIYILDRKSDMIISGGENVYPTEVENVLNRHEAVAESAVVGIDDPEWGEKIVAAVVPAGEYESADSLELEGAIQDFCREKIAGYKTPKSITFIDALPTTEVGKVRRTEVSAMLAEN